MSAWPFDVVLITTDSEAEKGQLPPMTPRFTYSRQEMFTRNFEW